MILPVIKKDVWYDRFDEDNLGGELLRDGYVFEDADNVIEDEDDLYSVIKYDNDYIIISYNNQGYVEEEKLSEKVLEEMKDLKDAYEEVRSFTLDYSLQSLLAYCKNLPGFNTAYKAYLDKNQYESFSLNKEILNKVFNFCLPKEWTKENIDRAWVISRFEGASYKVGENVFCMENGMILVDDLASTRSGLKFIVKDRKDLDYKIFPKNIFNTRMVGRIEFLTGNMFTSKKGNLIFRVNDNGGHYLLRAKCCDGSSEKQSCFSEELRACSLYHKNSQKFEYLVVPSDIHFSISEEDL